MVFSLRKLKWFLLFFLFSWLVYQILSFLMVYFELETPTPVPAKEELIKVWSDQDIPKDESAYFWRRLKWFYQLGE